jgi:hypothetical protein
MGRGLDTACDLSNNREYITQYMMASIMVSPRPSPEIVDGKAVRSLVEAHALQGAVIMGQPGGWAVLVRYGTVERAIGAQRSRQMRLWRRVDTAIRFVKDELGMPRFEIDTLDHQPDAVQRKRPDQSERQRRTHEAAAYDAWFRAQAQIGVDAANRGDFVPDDQMRETFTRMLDE